MKYLYPVSAIAIALALFVSLHSKAQAEPTTAPTSQPAIANKTCPITHDAINPKGKTVEYKGKTIGFCCEDCIKDFNADPEKYMASLK